MEAPARGTTHRMADEETVRVLVEIRARERYREEPA